jgi:hypothetical protein
MKKKNQDVVILWHGPPEGNFVSKLFRSCNWCNWVPENTDPMNNFSTVAYDSGNGYPRIYTRGQYDGRLGPDVPYFYNAREARDWMWTNPGQPCQVDIRSTKNFGFRPKGLQDLRDEIRRVA